VHFDKLNASLSSTHKNSTHQDLQFIFSASYWDKELYYVDYGLSKKNTGLLIRPYNRS